MRLFDSHCHISDEAFDENTLFYGNCDKFVSDKTGENGVVKLNVKVADDDVVVSMRGYMILKNSKGETEIYYTDVVCASYNGL